MKTGDVIAWFHEKQTSATFGMAWRIEAPHWKAFAITHYPQLYPQKGEEKLWYSEDTLMTRYEKAVTDDYGFLVPVG